MTKKEKHQSINREFLSKYESDFFIDDEMGGRLVLSHKNVKEFTTDGSYESDHSIDYHQSRHTVDGFNHSHPEIKQIISEMREMLDALSLKYEL